MILCIKVKLRVKIKKVYDLSLKKMFGICTGVDLKDMFDFWIFSIYKL